MPTKPKTRVRPPQKPPTAVTEKRESKYIVVAGPDGRRLDRKTGNYFCNQMSATGNKPCRMFVVAGTEKCRRHTEELSSALVRERQCTAMSSFNQERCRKYAVKGTNVCLSHGAKAPQVRKKAKQVLLAQVEPTIARLIDLRDQDEHPPTAFAAAKEILTRAVGKAEDSDGKKSGKGPQVIIGIALGGIDPSKVKAEVRQLQAPDEDEEDYEEAEIVDDADGDDFGPDAED